MTPSSIYTRSTLLPTGFGQTFNWHEHAGAFERLTPPWLKIKIIERDDGITDGSWVKFKQRFLPGIWLDWVICHREYEPPKQFCDKMVRGPFRYWFHRHLFLPRTDGKEGCRLKDHIEYTLPWRQVSQWAAPWLVDKPLERAFRYRHIITGRDLALHNAVSSEQRDATRRILVTGGSGMVGSALVPFLRAQGHEVHCLTRKPKTPTDIKWDPELGHLDATKIDGFDVVIHLAGENIMGAWTTAKKRRIRESRVQATQMLCEKLASVKNPPKVFLGASAVGYYGPRAEAPQDESAAPGSGFLAEVCRDWEAATHPLEARDVRVCHTRFGLVLSPAGGALRKMLLPFMACVGGRVGSGDQRISWTSMEDLLHGLYFCMLNKRMAGPVNMVAPQSVSNQEFSETLASVLRRPCWLPVSEGALNRVFGEAAEQTVLSSVNAVPTKLESGGYTFIHKSLRSALEECLGRW